MKVSLVNVVIGFVVLVIAVLVISGRSVPERIEEAKAEIATMTQVQPPVPTPVPLLEDHPLLDRVRNQMIDPGSAIFRNLVYEQDTGGICGEINGKNRMGGYVGFEPFFVTMDTTHLYSEYKSIAQNNQFTATRIFMTVADREWMRLCVCKATPYMCP